MPSNIGYPIDEKPDLVEVDTGTVTGGSSQFVKLAQSAEGSEAGIQADQYGQLVQASIIQQPIRADVSLTEPISIDWSNGAGKIPIIPVVTIENPALNASGEISVTGDIA